MSILQRNITSVGLTGILIFALVACGGKTTDEATETNADTGSLAIKIVYEPNQNLGSNREPMAFSSCHDINKVTAQVFDGADGELSALHIFDCDTKHGTIKGISKGIDRQVIVRGVLMGENGHETVFYEGRATGLTIDAGKTTYVDALVARFREPEDPEQLEALLFLADRDNDGYSKRDGDCDDSDPERHPDAIELCNMVDDNCNGMADEPYKTFFIDNDGDGYGDPNETSTACTPPTGYILDSSDCDDSNINIHPNMEEKCNGIDDNCDDLIDEMCPWNRVYDSSDYDSANSIIPGNNGGYVIAGATWLESRDNDVWIIKIDENGNEQWNRTYGGDLKDSANSIIPGNNGGYVIAGYTRNRSSDLESIDVLVIKIDENGNEQWKKTFGGANTDIGQQIISGNNGGYVIAGKTDSYGAGQEDGWIINIDDNGNELWNKTYGGSDLDTFYSIIQGNTGGYVIAGHTQDDCSDGWIAKIDDKGNELWNKIFGYCSSGSFNSIIQAKTGGYVLGGSFKSKYGWVVKIDESGNELWNKTFGANDYDDFRNSFRSVIRGNTGGYVVAGSAIFYEDISAVGKYNALAIKIDDSGNELWNKTFGANDYDSYQNTFCSVIQSYTGGYVVAGCNESYGSGRSDAWAVKMDENGNAPTSP